MKHVFICFISILIFYLHAVPPVEMVTRNLDPDNFPNITYREYLQKEKPSVTEVFEIDKNVNQRYNTMLIIVESQIYGEIETSLNTYIDDITMAGWSYYLITYSGNSVEDLKNIINDYYLENSIDGTFLIGDLPSAWYEMYEDFDNDGLPDDETMVEFPIDLFFMDLDGFWFDCDNDGMYDMHIDDTEPEIWLGRIKADNLSMIDHTESEIINLYFQRNHLYRIGGLEPATEGLAYIDDDWYTWGDYYQEQLALAIDNVELVNEVNATNAYDYRDNRLVNIYNFIQVHVHSSPASHYFYQNNGANYVQVYNSELVEIPARSYFYNLFCCSNANYETANNMGSCYLLSNDYGLGVIGSTKTGSMLSFENFYQPLSEDQTFGEAFKNWWQTTVNTDPAEENWQRSWFYGMTFLGDPLLLVKPNNDNCLYVDDNNNGFQDGSFIYPFDTIQQTVNQANDYDIIWVNDGVYDEHILIENKTVQLRSINGPSYCSINPTSNGIAVTCQIADSLVINGFHIEGAISSNVDGSAIAIFDAPTIISDCIFSDNEGDNGTVIATNSNLTISNCQITYNNCNNGSYFFSLGSQLTIQDCSITNNNTETNVNLIEVNGGEVQISHSVITNNSMNEGNILSINSPENNINIDNSLICNNHSEEGFTVVGQFNEFLITNTTIVNNNLELFAAEGNAVNLYNNIIWDDETTITVEFDGLVSADYNLSRFYLEGENNISLAPRLVDTDNGDYHLTAFSPAIGAASIDHISDTDLEGNPRPLPEGTNPDMGAYEHERYYQTYETIYVSTDGSDETGTGTDYAPFATINRAIDEVYPGSTILIEPGIYNENIEIPDKAMTITSRYSIGYNPEIITNTVINGNGDDSVIKLTGLENPVKLEGFTVQGGISNGGGGIRINSATVELKNLLIKDNQATLGGGLFISNGNTLLRNLTIVNNNANLFGGGIYSPNINGTNTIINCIIYSNEGEYEIFNNNSVYYSLTSELIDGEGNISGDPLFQENGFTLQDESPCIDSGINDFEVNEPFFFQIEYNEIQGETVDMGAFEYQLMQGGGEEIPNSRLNVNIYPNPFNPELIIEFSLSEISKLHDLSIYNIKGQKIYSFDIKEDQTVYKWNGKDKFGSQAGSGVYFCKVVTDEDMVLKKITLLK